MSRDSAGDQAQIGGIAPQGQYSFGSSGSPSDLSGSYPSDPSGPPSDLSGSYPPSPPPRQHVAGKTASGFFAFLLAVVVVAVLVVVFILRSDSDSKGNLDAFCALWDDGRQAQSQLNYEAMSAVAPKQIRPAVQKLQDSSKAIEELAQSDDLAAYFAAAFDRNAVQAERDLNAYVFVECDLEIDPAELEAALRSDIATFINQRYSSASWLGAAELDLTLEAGVLDGLAVELAAADLPPGAIGGSEGAEGSEDAAAAAVELLHEACRAYNEYLRSRLAPGNLTVRLRLESEILVTSVPDRNSGC